jgi:hypothetical protein
MDDFLLYDEGKLGYGFTSADELKQVDIGMVARQGRRLSMLS